MAATSKKPRSSQSSSAKKLLKSLPESVEHIEIVQQIACAIDELHKRVSDVKQEAGKELKKLLKQYEANYKGLEKKVHEVTSDAKRQAQTSMIHVLQKWHEHKEKFPSPLVKEIEKIIDSVGAKIVSSQSKTKKVKSAKKTVRAKKTASVRKKKAASAKKVKKAASKSASTVKASSSTSGDA